MAWLRQASSLARTAGPRCIRRQPGWLFSTAATLTKPTCRTRAPHTTAAAASSATPTSTHTARTTTTARTTRSATRSAGTMSEGESAKKKARTDEKYKLFYWPGIPGRGEPIRLALEEAGADYEDVAYTQGVNAVTALFKPEAGKHFAPPILAHGELEISQLPNIMLYLGAKLKLVPEDEGARFRVNQLFLTIADCQNEAHDTHHPLAVSEYYEDQKDAALRRAKDFRTTRIPKFFTHFEAVLTQNDAGKGEWLVGDGLTYADLMLFHLVDGLLFAFPRALAALQPKFPKVFALHESVKARPRVVAYLESDRRKKFSQGLYRYYPELDAPEEEKESAEDEE